MAAFAYYNEHEPTAVAWLRELIRQGVIADGLVDDRSIVDVRAEDLAGFRQCHFFAGIGGWSYALRLAGISDDEPVWTGSCPCQPFSSASRGRRVAVDCWPAFRHLIVACRPRWIFGEQVASAVDWFDGVCDDLEAVDYTIGAAVLPACSIGVDHARLRVYFAGHTDREGQSGLPVDAEVAGLSWDRSVAGDNRAAHGISLDVVLRRGYGNAIVPPLAAAFIASVVDAAGVSRSTTVA